MKNRTSERDTVQTGSVEPAKGASFLGDDEVETEEGQERRCRDQEQRTEDQIKGSFRAIASFALRVSQG